MTTLIDPAADPLELFGVWYADAERSEPNDPNAVALATLGADGMPAVRMVLMKGFGPEGFTFFTNYQSRKGDQLEQHPQAALCFHWKSRRRQVRVEGYVARVSNEASDAYFHGRPHGSRVGAWASLQSRPMPGRQALLARVADYEVKFLTQSIPRPEHWGGYLITPRLIELWQDMPFRLHDRVQFLRQADGQWLGTRLYP